MFFICFRYASLSILNAQDLGIGITDPKVVLEILSSQSGIPVTRLTTSQRNANSTASTIDGMLVHNTDLDQFEYYDHGDGWKAVINPISYYLQDTRGVQKIISF